MSRLAMTVVCGLVLVGCAASPVSADLEEVEANRIIVALDRAHIPAEKEADPAAEGRYRVMVARDDAMRSLNAMKEQDLPRARSAGVLDTLDKGALVPSQTAEHARLVAGLAGDLERTLVAIDGVISARVHLNLPTPEPFGGPNPAARATASVLVEHSGTHAPVSLEDVQRLVAGAVGGLTATEVQTVFVPRAAVSTGIAASQFSHVGPILVASSSARMLQLFMVLALVTLVAFGAGFFAIRRMLVKAREELAEAINGQKGARS